MDNRVFEGVEALWTGLLSICDPFGEREKLENTRWEHSRCRSGYLMEDRRHGMEAWDRAAGCASLWRWRAGDGDVRGLR